MHVIEFLDGVKLIHDREAPIKDFKRVILGAFEAKINTSSSAHKLG